jgi:hypothetical protein
MYVTYIIDCFNPFLNVPKKLNLLIYVSDVRCPEGLYKHVLLSMASLLRFTVVVGLEEGDKLGPGFSAVGER